MTRSVDVLWPSGRAHAVPCGYMPWHVSDNAPQCQRRRREWLEEPQVNQTPR